VTGEGSSITQGFLVVKRFEVLYREFSELPRFAERPTSDCPVYAIPIRGTSPEQAKVRYRGLDRDALSPYDKGKLAEARLAELKRKFPYWTDEALEDFVPTIEEARDVLRWADYEFPDAYELVWARIASNSAQPPEGFVRLGYDPTYFGGDHFSAICDCMCFPRWHGTDPEGQIFLKYFERLNKNGLFDNPALASDFLAYYLSFDWTETGEYEIGEVWAPGVSGSGASGPGR
jgi:hypothetical protein